MFSDAFKGSRKTVVAYTGLKRTRENIEIKDNIDLRIAVL